MKTTTQQRRKFLRSAAGLGSVAALPALAAAAPASGRAKAPGGIRVGNMYFSSGLTGVRPEARKDPLAFGGDIKEQTDAILKLHKTKAASINTGINWTRREIYLRQHG